MTPPPLPPSARSTLTRTERRSPHLPPSPSNRERNPTQILLASSVDPSSASRSDRRKQQKANPYNVAYNRGAAPAPARPGLVVLRDTTWQDLGARYELVGDLGRGEFGITYLCTVQAGVKILRDKQEIVETQIQLANLKVPKAEDAQSETTGAEQADSRHQPTPPQPTIQPQSQATLPAQPPAALLALLAPTVPPPPLLQNQPPSQFPGHLPHSQVPSVPPAQPAPAAQVLVN